MNKTIHTHSHSLSSSIPKIFNTATKLSTSWPSRSSLILPYKPLPLSPPAPPSNNNENSSTEIIKPMTTNFILTSNSQNLLLLQRRADANPFPGMWSAVSGRLEFLPAGGSSEDRGEWESPLMGAVREIREEIGVQVEDQGVELVTAKTPIEVRTTGVVWLVWVLLWRMRGWEEGKMIRLNGENVGWEFLDVGLVKGRKDLVPGLGETFEKVYDEWKSSENG